MAKLTEAEQAQLNELLNVTSKELSSPMPLKEALELVDPRTPTPRETMEECMRFYHARLTVVEFIRKSTSQYD